MYGKIFLDPELAHYYANINKEKVKNNQKIYLASVFGGL
jgi:hypothetical protein